MSSLIKWIRKKINDVEMLNYFCLKDHRIAFSRKNDNDACERLHSFIRKKLWAIIQLLALSKKWQCYWFFTKKNCASIKPFMQRIKSFLLGANEAIEKKMNKNHWMNNTICIVTNEIVVNVNVFLS